MNIGHLITFLENIAPLSYQEDYDNSGLIVGDPNRETSKALISLDCTEEVVEEAIGEKIEVPASVQFLLDKAKVSIPLAANYTAFKHWMMQN